MAAPPDRRAAQEAAAKLPDDRAAARAAQNGAARAAVNIQPKTYHPQPQLAIGFKGPVHKKPKGRLPTNQQQVEGL